MESESVEECLALFNEICIDNNPDTHDEIEYLSKFWKSLPHPPPEPKTYNNFLDFNKYVEEKCGNKIIVLDRETFHQIRRPIMICFNHFREKCFYLTKYLDRLNQLALKYGDQINIIAADLIDMDIIHPTRNPIAFFCCLVSPENESLSTYIINERGQLFQHYDAYQTVETLSEVCDKLLNGSLYISQSVPEKTTDSLIKLAVHLNYDEMVTNSTKDILLIVGLGDYKKFQEHEPNYEQISQEMNDSNMEIVYIDGDKNYVPHELNAYCYPTILFIPHNDKKNFIHFSKCPRGTATVLEFIKENNEPGAETKRKKETLKSQYKPFVLRLEQDLEFKDLQEYLNQNYPKSFKVLERKKFNELKSNIIIYFMDIEDKGVAFHLKTLEKIYQVSERTYQYSVHFLVADVKDLDILYPHWYKQYLPEPNLYTDIPKVFGIDRMKRVFQADDFNTASSLYYFYFDLIYNRLYLSQPMRFTKTLDRITTCVADNLNILLQKSKTHAIFLTIYRPNYKESFKVLQNLDEIALEVKKLQVKLFKLDAQHNYVPLEYSYPTYPVHFFIPCTDKARKTNRLIGNQQSKQELLDFIKKKLRNVLIN